MAVKLLVRIGILPARLRAIRFISSRARSIGTSGFKPRNRLQKMRAPLRGESAAVGIAESSASDDANVRHSSAAHPSIGKENPAGITPMTV